MDQSNETDVKRPARPRKFNQALLKGRCRRNLALGLLGLLIALQYGGWTAWQFSRPRIDLAAFDRPLLRAAASMVPPSDRLDHLRISNPTELYLSGVIYYQQDLLFALSLLTLRGIVTLTLTGLSLVALTAGATEWEIRSALEGRTAPSSGRA